MDAFRAYLAWQAELGGDEVMVASPLSPRPAAVTPSGARPSPGSAAVPESPVPSGHGRAADADLSHPPSGAPDASLYAMLAKSLQASEDSARAARRPAVLAASAAAAAAPAAAADDQASAPSTTSAPGSPTASSPALRPDGALPPLPDLAACRDYLERNGRTLFTGEVPAAAWTFVHGTGPGSAPLALVGLEASAADGAAGLPFQGPGGLLLEKMMRAIRLDLATLYRTLVVKLPAPGPGRRCYTRRDLVRLLPLFHAELEAARTPVALLLGEACAQAVLKTGRGLEELRLAPHRVEGYPGREFAVTYHPDELEGNEELKRKAWKDLQWLQARLQGG